LAKYVKKGHQIGAEGNIQTRTYDDKNGTKHYITEVVVESIYFLESKKQEENNYQNQSQSYDRPQNQMPNQNQANNNSHEMNVSDFQINSDDLPF